MSFTSVIRGQKQGWNYLSFEYYGADNCAGTLPSFREWHMEGQKLTGSALVWIWIVVTEKWVIEFRRKKIPPMNMKTENYQGSCSETTSMQHQFQDKQLKAEFLKIKFPLYLANILFRFLKHALTVFLYHDCILCRKIGIPWARVRA